MNTAAVIKGGLLGAAIYLITQGTMMAWNMDLKWVGVVVIALGVVLGIARTWIAKKFELE